MWGRSRGWITAYSSFRDDGLAIVWFFLGVHYYTPLRRSFVRRSKCRRLRAQTGDLALVVIDYLQLMRSANQCVENRNQYGGINRVSRFSLCWGEEWQYLL